MENDGTKIALTLMADSAGQRVKSYVDRGRLMQKLSDDDLSAMMVWAHREFEKAGFNPHSKERLFTDDVGAEYDLRGLDGPYHLVKDQVDRMVAVAAASFEATDAERLDEINAEMVKGYEAIKRSEH